MDCCRACRSVDETENANDALPETVRVAIRARKPSMLAIRVRLEAGEVADHPVTKDVVVVGRSAERADIVLGDRTISRIQCRFIFRDGSVEVEDLGSACGTMVLGHRISRTTLGWGDIVRVGNSELEIVRG